MSDEDAGFSQLVVIGSSAGGIEALSRLVATLPKEFGAPIVVAQHLDPRRVSRLGEILARHSTLPVRTVADYERLQPGTVFVVPADRDIEITDHDIRLRSEPTLRHPKPSIDLLLTSAARQFGERLVAVILTGTGSDGATGARAVHNAGGTVVIQDPQTASYPALPLSLAPTTVDVVADLEAIGPLLHDLLTGAYSEVGPEDDRTLRMFLEQLRERSGIDFTSYKTPTILRRLQRRIVATGTGELETYLNYLQRQPDEYQRLVSSFLIKVTEFFRDPELFGHLRERTLPDLIAYAAAHGKELRLWSAGCATGEEAYSLAILVAEALGDELGQFTVRIFATDVDSEAINFARRGVYPASALEQLPRDLLERYFVEVGGAYEIRKAVRGMTVFGQHDLGQRAPFPRIDLALCRNVLIYFTKELQRRALQLFAFSLREGGYLALGKSETTSPLSEYFVLEQTRLKIYRRQGERALIPAVRIKDSVPLLAPPITPGPPLRTIAEVPRARELERARTRFERSEHLLLRMPVGVAVVDRHYDIQSINNTARRLLGIHEPAIGEDFLHLTRGAPTAELRAAIDTVLRTGQPTDTLMDVQLAGGERHTTRVECYVESDADSPGERAETVVVLLLDVTGEVSRELAMKSELDELRRKVADFDRRVAQMNEVNSQLLQANEELSTANAELRSSNEELLVANEEAQAATEEVETLNEELQATNEELETLNEELQATVEELNTTNDDLQARSVELQDLAVSLEDQRRAIDDERLRLESVVASFPDAFALIDRHADPILTNPAFDHLFGSSPDAVTFEDESGRPLSDHEQPRRRVATGETFNVRFVARWRDGKQRLLEARASPIVSDESEQGAGLLVIRELPDDSS